MISFKQFFEEKVLHTGGVVANITDPNNPKYIDLGQVKSISDLQDELGNGSLSYWITTDGNIISGDDQGAGDETSHWDILQSHFPLVFGMDTDIAEQERFLNENGYFSLSMFSDDGFFIRSLYGIEFPRALVRELRIVLTKIDQRLKVVVKTG